MKTQGVVEIIKRADRLVAAVKEVATGLLMTPQLTQDLDAVSELTGLLDQAWSDMAIRNLLTDLLRTMQRLGTHNLKPPPPPPKPKGFTLSGHRGQTVGQQVQTWERHNKPSPEAIATMIAQLKTRISSELGRHSFLHAKYKNVICIGYRVKCVGNSYSGSTDDRSDMVSRCDELKLAIKRAHSVIGRMGNDHSEGDTLKIFMAPEFFFRGGNGAYDHSVVHGEVGKTLGIMETMAQECDKDIYKNWLFVMGTAIAATKFTETVCAVCNTPAVFEKDTNNPLKTVARCKVDKTHATKEKVNGAMVENVALVRKEKEGHTVSKELVSHIDYLEDEGLGTRDHVTVKGSGTPERLEVMRTPQPSGRNRASPMGTKFDTKFKDERMGGCIFTVDGITIGLEVCLDHYATVSTDGGSGRLQHAGNIQVQLIPSAGMDIKSLRTVHGGIVFNVDGLTPHVQVVGGTGALSYRSQTDGHWQHTGLTWEERKSKGLNLDLTVGTWNNIAPPRMEGAARGPVLVYGPFTLPPV